MTDSLNCTSVIDYLQCLSAILNAANEAYSTEQYKNVGKELCIVAYSVLEAGEEKEVAETLKKCEVEERSPPEGVHEIEDVTSVVVNSNVEAVKLYRKGKGLQLDNTMALFSQDNVSALTPKLFDRIGLPNDITEEDDFEDISPLLTFSQSQKVRSDVRSSRSKKKGTITKKRKHNTRKVPKNASSTDETEQMDLSGL